MRKYFLIILLSIFSLPLWAENVTNIRVRQEGKSIIVTYDLNKKSVVRLMMKSGNDGEYIELKAITGDIGKGIKEGKNRKIVWKPLEENESFIAQNVQFKVDAQTYYEYYTQNAKIKTLVIGEVGYSVVPQLNYGIMIGQMYKGVGWYVSGRSNFQFNIDSELSCEQGGLVDGLEAFYNGEKLTSSFIVDGGLLVNFLEWSNVTKNKFNTLGAYLGLGYGKRELFWQTTDGQWIKYLPTSSSGISTSIGLFGSVYGVTMSVGVSTIAFKYAELSIGIGYMF